MSRQFNDVSGLSGLVQKFEKETGKQYGDVSGNPVRLKEFVSATRSAWDRYLYFAFKSAGTHQFDDANHSKYPFVETDLVANRRDYTISTDEEDALVLEIFKVLIKDPGGVYFEADPIDQQRRGQGQSIWDGQNQTGTPQRYDKTARGIILDVLPDYSWRLANEGERGIKMFVNREASYFKTTDTTKMPGCPGIHHDYFYLYPAMEEARINNLSNYNALKEAVLYYEGNEELGITGIIEKHFAGRSKDEKPIIKPKITPFI